MDAEKAAWLEQRCTELSPDSALDDGALDDRLARLRQAYEDQQTLFGMMTTPEVVAEKTERLRKLGEHWEKHFSLAPAERRVRVGRSLSFLRSSEPLARTDVTDQSSALIAALTARWPGHVHVAAGADPADLAALRAVVGFPPGVEELFASSGGVWVATEDVQVDAKTYAEHTRAFGKPNLSGVAGSGKGCWMWGPFEAVRTQLLAGVKPLELGGGRRAEGAVQFSVSDSGAVTTKGAHSGLPVGAWLKALAAGLDAWKPSRLLPPAKWKESRPTVAQLVDPAAKAGRKRKQLKDLGDLPLSGPLVLWHPLVDLANAPRLQLVARPRLFELLLGKDRAGYVLRTPEPAVSWRALADVSTDTDRFFLFDSEQTRAVAAWMNEDAAAFEQLGGRLRKVETAARGDGTSVVVLPSHDGDARIHAGYSASGQLAAVFIDIDGASELVEVEAA